jgi:lysophospholipase L1-like esterase/type 1 glutamine amidotransferase
VLPALLAVAGALTLLLAQDPQSPPAPAATLVPVPSAESRAAAAGWSAGGDWLRQHEDCCTIARRGGVELVLLGDSITQSFGGDGRQVAAPGAAARAKWLAPIYTVANFGISGDRTQHLLWRIANGTLDGLDPRAVVIAIGTNNLHAGDAPADVAAGIVAVIDAVRARLPRAAIVVQAILPCGPDAGDPMRRAVAATNALLAREPRRSHVTLADFGDRFVTQDGKAHPERLAGDHLHLTAAGYAAWAEALAPVLAAAVAALPRHVVFVAGDEEYRSEESLPLLANLLAATAEVRTTVCLPRDAKGKVDPQTLDHIDGLQALDAADLMVLFTRFRALPEQELRRIEAHVERGRPVVGFRTATHAFRYPEADPRARYNDAWPVAVFGQKWIAHHGHFDDGKAPLCDVAPVESAAAHPILRGVHAFAAFSWLYHVDGGGDALPADCQRLLLGTAKRSGLADETRYPRTQPVAWLRELPREHGPPQRVFFTTLGHPFDFHDDSMRRLCVQGLLWALGQEAAIPAAGVPLAEVGWDPPNSGVGGHRR